MGYMSQLGTIAFVALSTAAVAAAPVAQDGSSRDDGSLTLGGRVLFPEGTPADERVEVVLAGLRDPDAEGEMPDFLEHFLSGGGGVLPELGRVELGPDSEFSIPVPAGHGSLHLRVEGDYLDLNHRVTAEELAEPADLRLHPNLGAHVTYVLVPPAGAEALAGSLVGRSVGIADLSDYHNPPSPILGRFRYEAHRIEDGLRVQQRRVGPFGRIVFEDLRGKPEWPWPLLLPDEIEPRPEPGTRVEIEVHMTLSGTNGPSGASSSLGDSEGGDREATDDHGRMLRGVVDFPEGTPADERAFVVLAGVPLEPVGDSVVELTERLELYAAERKLEYQRAALGPDGTFEFRVPPRLEMHQLWVDGDFLHLTHDLGPGELDGTEPIVLHPRLGAEVTLVFKAPEGTDPGIVRALEGRVVSFVDRTQEGPAPLAPGFWYTPIRHVPLAPGLRLRLRVHSPSGSATFDLAEGPDQGLAPFYVAETVTPRPRPGSRIEFEVPLRLGVTITGRVVDSEGLPIVGAYVESSEIDVAVAKTDAKGEFALFARSEAVGTVTVRHPDFATRTWPADQRPSTLELERPRILDATDGELPEGSTRGGSGSCQRQRRDR